MENQDRKKTRKPVWILLLSLVCVLAVFAGVWLVLHEKTQSRNIVSLVTRAEEQTAMEESLSAAIDTLSERINRQDKNREPAVWGTGYNWFAIGNSLTLIEGFGHGICSTQPDNDYFGIVKAFLEKQYGDVTASRVHFGVWEQSAYRNAMFDFVDPYLSPDLDLVTVQLGENVSVIERPVSGYREDLKELVLYIRGDDIEEVSLATSIDNEPLGRISIVRHWWKWTDDGTTLFVIPRRERQCQSY